VRLTSLRAAILATFLAVAVLFVGCGSGSSHTPPNAELALERAQLVQVSNELHPLVAPVRREVAASRAAWPAIANGLPATLSGSLQSAVVNASTAARALPEPRFMTHPGGLTGPAAGVAGLYESYSRLASKGWRLTETGIAAILRGTPAAASFARSNSSLYIDAIYDGHFDLSLLGKSLVSGYEKLGGAAAFGARLPLGEVTALAAAYSIPAVRLEPHPGRGVSEA
jgi:hypothetical protein